MWKRLLLVAVVVALSIGCRCNSERKAKPQPADQTSKQASAEGSTQAGRAQ